jgi:uncharacterized protein YodC (DUF2158 family)
MIKPGDVVVLKSHSSQKMTVGLIEESGLVKVHYFDVNNELQTKWIDLSSLTLLS